MAIRSRPSYRILIIGSSGSGKTNTLLSLIKEQDDTDNLFECKRFKWTQISIFDQKVRRCRNKTVKWSKCIYWVLKYDGWLYESIDHYNPSRKRKILTVFDDMIVDIITNKKFQTIIKELFIRCKKLNISLMLITQSYFPVPKDVRLNSTHYLIMKLTTTKNYKILQLIILQKLIIRIL